MTIHFPVYGAILVESSNNNIVTTTYYFATEQDRKEFIMLESNDYNEFYCFETEERVEV